MKKQTDSLRGAVSTPDEIEATFAERFPRNWGLAELERAVQKYRRSLKRLQNLACKYEEPLGC